MNLQQGHLQRQHLVLRKKIQLGSIGDPYESPAGELTAPALGAPYEFPAAAEAGAPYESPADLRSAAEMTTAFPA